MTHFLCSESCSDISCKGKQNVKDLLVFSKDYLVNIVDVMESIGIKGFKTHGKECTQEDFLAGVQKVTLEMPVSMGLGICMYALTNKGFEVVIASLDDGFFTRELAASTTIVEKGKDYDPNYQRDTTHDGEYVAFDEDLVYMGSRSVHDVIPFITIMSKMMLNMDEEQWVRMLKVTKDDKELEKLKHSRTTMMNCRLDL